MTDTEVAPRAALSETLLRVFRLVAIVEGITTLALFVAAMPIKYGMNNSLRAQIIGSIHGNILLACIALMIAPVRDRGWSATHWGRTAVTSFMPFGTFLSDPFLKRRKAAEMSHAIE